MRHHLHAAILAVAIAISPALRLTASEPNALVSVAVASLRSEPDHASQLETQALMGTPVRLIERDGDWWLAVTPDSYRAWINASAVASIDSTAMEQWKQSRRLICTSIDECRIFSEPDAASLPVSDMVLGCILEGCIDPAMPFAHVTLPDNRSGWVDTTLVEPFDIRMSRRPDPQRMIRIATRLNGVAYLWGGNSTKGVDCSGLIQLCYFDCGILIPRNASQQALCGLELPIDGTTTLHQSDLLFFTDDKGRVEHVALYQGDGLYRHASGTVHLSSMLTESPLYNGRVVTSARHLLSDTGSKIAGAVADLPIAVIRHPWYFRYPD